MKKFVAPLQAIALLLLCSGMAWMVFVLASINPTPPTVMDLQARNTQDLSFASMNSTAVALAKQMLAEVVPSPTGPYFLPVTGRETMTPGPSAAMTLKPVFTLFNSSTPTSYHIAPTATRNRQNKPPVAATYTTIPTKTLPPATNTSTKTIPTTVTSPPVDTPTTKPTDTPVPPEPTHTSVPPTDPPTLPPQPTDPPPTSTSPPIVVATEPPPTQSTP